MSVPIYMDGVLIPCELVNSPIEDSPDYPRHVIKPKHTKIWFRALSIYDRTRLNFQNQDLEITMKIRIPYYEDGFHSGDVVLIKDTQMSVFNASIAWTKDGLRETELTLTKPRTIYEVET
jgi:SPP1 family predicted phage head-tail adaptor